MTNEQAKQAFLDHSPVIFSNIIYTRIKQIIYWLDDYDNLHISLQLADKNGNSYTTANIKDVTIYDKQNQTTHFMP